MKRALFVIALCLPLIAVGTVSAQEAAKKEVKAAPKKAAPAKAATPAAADPKKAEPVKAAPKKAAPKKGAEAAKPVADAGEGHSCNCDKKIAFFTKMRDEHKALAESYKDDPVLKALKASKDKKALGMYQKRANENKKFHKKLADTFGAQVKALEKAHKAKGPKMCEKMKEAPEEVQAAMKEMHQKQAEHMKAIATAMNDFMTEKAE